MGYLGLSSTLLVAGGMYLGAAAFTQVFIGETREAAREKSVPLNNTISHMIAQWNELLHDANLQGIMCLNAVSVGTHAGAFYTLMPLMLAGDLGLSPIEIGSVFAFQSAIAVFGVAPATFAIERVGSERILAPPLG